MPKIRGIFKDHIGDMVNEVMIHLYGKEKSKTLWPTRVLLTEMCICWYKSGLRDGRKKYA